MNSILCMVKRNIMSYRFMIAVVLVVLLCGCVRLDAVFESTISVIKAYVSYSHAELLGYGEYASAYYVVMYFLEQEWFSVLFPVLAAFPCVYEFADEWLSGNYYITVSRTNKNKYCIGRFVSTAISGALVIIVGVLIFALLIYIRFPALSEYPADELFLFGMQTGGQLLLQFVKRVLHLGMHGALSAIIAVVLMIVLEDRFYALSIPMMIEFMGIKIDGVYISHLVEKYGYSYPHITQIPRLLNPACHLDMDQTFVGSIGLPYRWYLLYVFLLFIGLFTFLNRLMKRRNE